MLKTINIPSEVIEALERAIVFAVQDRIDNDPDVADTYLRVTVLDNKFKVQVMYLEESNASQPNRDKALLDLMYNSHESPDYETWTPDTDAIHDYAASFSKMIELDTCLN